ncbi:MAG TPA: 50S ribosomal protein L1 [Oligoflexia bacterium]|nr:50S ribosomal protein L1 [Oligoflexia bacterium]HMP48016.1 50S ribosomal protein L1 [Oligoflexia bacterium]
MAKSGKRLQSARKLVEAEKHYSLEEAVQILEKFPKAKFDESIDLAINLGVNPRKAEENVRGTVALPHGRGKTIRVAAFCKGEKAKEAEAAGADIVGAEDLVQKIQGGWMEFDAAVATPDSMALVGRIGKLLGPRGLMPNPKVGTVTPEIGKAVEAIKSGRVEFRVEKAGVLHVGLAKASFGAQKIQENVNAVVEAVVKAKPATSKGTYIKAASLSSTMGPGIRLDVSSFKF